MGGAMGYSGGKKGGGDMAKKYKKRRYDKHRAEKTLLIAVVIALLLQLVPVVYRVPDYEELSVKKVTVESVEEKLGRYSSHSYFLITADGERMKIVGEFSGSELLKKLQSDTEVTIKYHPGIYFPDGEMYVMELTCDGALLVAYDGRNMQKENHIGMLIVGGGIILVGVLFYDYEKNYVKRVMKRYKYTPPQKEKQTIEKK